MTETPQHERQATDPDTSADNPEHPGNPVDMGNLRDYSQLRRSVTDRKIAGVAGGLGRHLNVDPTILRVLFVVLCFFGGAGFVVYGVAWLLVPEEGREQAKVRTSPSTRNVLLIVAAVFAALLLLGDSWGDFGPPWPVAVIALLVFVVLLNRDKPMNATSGPTTDTMSPATQQAAQPLVQPPVQPPASRRDRGPKLFWVTLALVALALGALGLYENAGGSVVDSAYPALALTVVGAMLVLGAWVGRPGGLILLGVIAALALAASAAAGARFEDGPSRIDVAPAEAALVQDRYYVPAGEIRLDLSLFDDIDKLDGRRIDLEANAGEIEVIVPEGVDVNVIANLDIGGEASVLGYEENGPNVYLDRQVDGGTGAPELDLDLRLLVGNIDVNRAN